MAAEFLLDFRPVVPASHPGARPPFPVAAPVSRRESSPKRVPLLGALRHFLRKRMSIPQLQRDLREVENELRLARNRLAYYTTLGEQTLATDCHRVVLGHEQLRTTLTARLQALSHGKEV